MAQVQRSEDRYAAAVARVYANDRIEVTWEPGYCIHWAACIRGSMKAFNPQRRPWIDVDAETPERIAEIVSRCPTGALHARWKDGTPAEMPPEPLVATPTLDGPLFLRGHIRMLDREGRVIREDTRVALCRCGHSQNKPFCDDSHFSAQFQSADEHLGPDPDDPDAFASA
ncbi:MAG: hypothetical protein EPO16_07810 [Dehalococcoidia bacterium]|nr:MAG: hypothetical protein EPO16_07810 [Dehalococcoidia bacterium]